MDYTGATATLEILIMLGVAFILGYMFRWLQNRFWGCEHCVESEIEAEIRTLKAEQSSHTKVVTASKHAQDDLKVIEGIGPKISELLHDAGITTWSKLADATPSKLSEVLQNAGERFRLHDPSTWPEQSALARDGKWDELEKLQTSLQGGKTKK